MERSSAVLLVWRYFFCAHKRRGWRLVKSGIGWNARFPLHGWHPVFQPTAIVSGVTAFGGAGLLLDRYTSAINRWLSFLQRDAA